MRRFASPLIAAALIAATMFTALVDTSAGLLAGEVTERPLPARAIDPTHPTPGVAAPQTWAPESSTRPVPILDPAQPRDAELPTRPTCDDPQQGPECVRQAYVAPTDPATLVARLVPDDVTGVGDWEPLVASFFDASDLDRALAVIRCESGGDPSAKNPHSTASGLFQHLGSYWAERSTKAGIAGADIFDPVANVTVAAWLVYEGGGWSHWNPSRHCWG